MAEHGDGNLNDLEIALNDLDGSVSRFSDRYVGQALARVDPAWNWGGCLLASQLLQKNNACGHLVITGATGLGKSWLACALGQKACREDLSVLYYRMPRLFETRALARGDGRYGKLLRSLARVRLLILDDWGPETLTPEQARDLLEIVEDRYDAGSILITSQVPINRWHDMTGIPTLADAILDRLDHNADRIELSSESLRKRRAS
jgi:DNA replication protein DnaC